MFEVEWQLDEEEELNLVSLLGRIQVTDGVYSILEPSVYLDSWFAVLLRVAKTVPTDETAVEIPEHPHKLVVWRDQAGHVHLMFRENEVIAESPQIFREAIVRAAEAFLNRTASIPGQPEPQLREVQTLLKSA
jgi:hypothetical protein